MCKGHCNCGGNCHCEGSCTCNHSTEHQCDICKHGVEAFEVQEAEFLEKYGHSIRYVMDEYEFEGHTFPSIYTYGLIANQIQEYEFECVLPIDQPSALHLLNTLAQKAKEGMKFEFDTVYHLPELNEVPFYLIPALQCGVGYPLARVILADSNHCLPNDEDCEPVFAIQPIIGVDKIMETVDLLVAESTLFEN